MKRLRSVLLPLLALALTLGSAPLQACISACSKGGNSRACLRVCANSKALLTHGGKLASMGKADCGLRLAAGPVLAASPSFQLEAPSTQALALAERPALAPALLALGSAAERGPPEASPFLSSQHPFAQGPPTLL